MPKAATHALIWSAQSKTYTLLCPDSQPQSLVSGNEESWLAWLATHSSFSFQGQCGQLSVLKESRQRGEGYWYAYHTTQSVTRKRYLGRATMVTLERLEKVAHELSRSPSPAMRALVTAKLPVLATYGIRPPNKAFENTQSGLLLLVDSEEEEYNLKHSSAHLHKGVMYTVHGILTFIKRLTGVCLQSLHQRFVCWTKPDTTSLLLGMLTDLARSKSELVADNALLRQQLIILRRQVKRPACTKTDRMLLVLLARMVRAWKQALFIVQPETLQRWHRQGFRLFWKYKSRAAALTPKISAETVA